ncbi:MAG: hypothetical protein Q8M31_02990 [Beijerinckiaceae bacterium]|nr:hypothetical protein [Beijerinckiaceae bacterium]
MSRLANILVAAALSLSTASAALADTFELLMFERAGCVYCVRWDREVGPAYPLTPQGQLAPLRKISLDNGQPKGLGLDMPVRYSPTFVLMKDGKEAGRITGYMSDAMFWGIFAKMLEAQQKPVAQEGRS